MEFWQSFRCVADELNNAIMRGEARFVFDNVNSQLQCNGIHFAFDISSDHLGGLLIFSPEGNFEVARAIDAFVEGRRMIGPWRIFTRRQRKHLSDAAAIVRNLYFIDVSDAKFSIGHYGQSNRVTMHQPETSQMTTDERQAMVFTYLCHALGEEVVMKKHIKSEFSILLTDHPLTATELVNRFVSLKWE